jgi:hypothetical protein
MEFRGIVNLDQHTADQLSQYLIEKESTLSLKIIDLIGPVKENEPELKSYGTTLKIEEAVLLFGKKIRSISTNRDFKPAKGNAKKVASEISKYCWQYLEILENSVTELFLQIKLMDITDLKESAWDAAFAIKMTLMHHMEDLEWALKRLNAQIAEVKYAEDGKNFLSRIKNLILRKSKIDSSLLSNLQKSRKYLSFNYGKFHDEYVNYQALYKDVRKHVLKLVDYQVLNHLETVSRETFKKLYELIKIWESNLKSRLIPLNDLKIPLRESTDPKRVSHIFEEYHNELLNELFQKSRNLKIHADEILNNENVKSELENSLNITLKEIHTLAATARNYREFLLKTDPDPYVRCRFGFGEWVLGKEPAITRNMALLTYEIDETNQSAEQLIQSVKIATQDSEKVDLTKALQKIEKPLHDMSQPLIGKSTMQSLAEEIVGELKKVDELGSFDIKVVDFIGNILSKLLKADWKYHVLFDMPNFEKIYSTHVGIADHGDRLHLNRLNEFRRLCREIKELVKHKSFYAGVQDIEFHLNDIKGSLQDFLGYVQRVTLDKENSSELFKDIHFQLLEYRYFFGKYFHEREMAETETQLIRNKFLFVDQYLDTVDDLLSNLS